jgi:hypothetical protein
MQRNPYWPLNGPSFFSTTEIPSRCISLTVQVTTSASGSNFAARMASRGNFTSMPDPNSWPCGGIVRAEFLRLRRDLPGSGCSQNHFCGNRVNRPVDGDSTSPSQYQPFPTMYPLVSQVTGSPFISSKRFPFVFTLQAKRGTTNLFLPSWLSHRPTTRPHLVRPSLFT